MPHLTAFQRDALVVLAGGASHGLGIKAALEDYYDAEVNHGRLYPNLDDLAARGLVDKERGSPDARSNEYSLTARGRAALRAHRDWEEQYLGGDA